MVTWLFLLFAVNVILIISSIIEICTLCVGEKRLLKSYSYKSDLFMALMFSGHLSNVRCPGRGHDFT